MQNMDAWVIFDADNTLWDIEYLYDDARKELVGYIAKQGYSALEIEGYQRNRDKQLITTYGYSACRFARSFEDTVIKFIGNDEKSIIHCRKLALDVFERPANLTLGLEELLPLLKKDFKIGIITAGEKWVQERRLDHFHLLSEIDQVQVVEQKNCDVFLQFSTENSITIEESWVVGDSLRSDIAPAKQAGFKTIHYANHNWQAYEYVEGIVPDFKINELKEIIEILGA